MEEASGPAPEVWPDNVLAVNVFMSLMTQWQPGPSGVIGLRYEVIPGVMRMMAVPRKEWPDVFEAIQIMEAVALEEIQKGE